MAQIPEILEIGGTAAETSWWGHFTRRGFGKSLPIARRSYTKPKLVFILG